MFLDLLIFFCKSPSKSVLKLKKKKQKWMRKNPDILLAGSPSVLRVENEGCVLDLELAN